MYRFRAYRCDVSSKTIINLGGVFMDWMDFSRDGKIDAAENFMGIELLCGTMENENLSADDSASDEDEIE